MESEPQTETTPAPVFIEKWRRAFPSLYPSDHAFLLNLLACQGSEWDSAGNLCRGDGDNLKDSFTDKGWESMKLAHNADIPTHWPKLDKRSALLRIPDHVTREWRGELFMFAMWLTKLDPEGMKSYLALHQQLSRRGTQTDVARNFEAFMVAQRAGEDILQRLRDIDQAEVNRQVRPWEIAVGVTVHLKCRPTTETATVVCLYKVPAADDQPATTIAILDQPLFDSASHHVARLVPLTHPPRSEVAAAPKEVEA